MPSGSGNEISEMPQSPKSAALYELGTRHTSVATSPSRRQSDRNRNAIFIKTGILRESSDSSEAPKGSLCVETKITSSPRHKSMDLSRPLPTPPQRTLEYLNRALPSPPSSNRTQSSPTKTSTSSPVSAMNGNHRLSSRTSISESGTIPPDTAIDMIWEDYDMSWDSQRRQQLSILSSSSTDIKIMIVPEVTERYVREYTSLSSISTDFEIVVPPGTPSSQIPSSASSRNEGRQFF